ncbi:hypothetical protein NEF87_002884 [Candidatus Lokiarchaeum ossiferum]|uniref:Uncharacterized protein n=1 Tax=Candidatus Lokiarchaeum ossiferum TaxID=2951803 RepID=A0ABY6HSW8_9ARCH|nr:hypothetical protein NEF87_002884 [Candidatus Lokiarchaeum sp. B-35]
MLAKHLVIKIKVRLNLWLKKHQKLPPLILKLFLIYFKSIMIPKYGIKAAMTDFFFNSFM